MLSRDSVRSIVQSCLFDYAELKWYHDLPIRKQTVISDPGHFGPSHFGPQFLGHFGPSCVILVPSSGHFRLFGCPNLKKAMPC